MRNIIVSTSINENSHVNIEAFFNNASDYRLVSLNMKVICSNGEIYSIFSNKMIYISNDSSLWINSVKYEFSATPLKAIVEIHSSGKLLYTQSFSLCNNCQDGLLYIINTDVRWREEDPFVISVFNTNGNLLFLRGIYKELWELLLTPSKPEDVISVLTKKGYDELKIKSSINSLIKRGIVIEEQMVNIEYI